MLLLLLLLTKMLANVYLVVDDVVYSFSDVDALLDVHSDAVHDDQLDADDVLILILDATLIYAVIVVILLLYDVVADPGAFCISLLMDSSVSMLSISMLLTLLLLLRLELLLLVLKLLLLYLTLLGLHLCRPCPL